MAALTKYEYICHPIYLIVSGGLNLPPFIFGVLAFVEWCDYYSSWLVGNAALTGLNVAAAIYCVYKIRKIARPPPTGAQRNSPPREGAAADIEKNGSDTESNPNRNGAGTPYQAAASSPTRRSHPPGCFSRLMRLRTVSSGRIRHLVCHDGLSTTYAILFIFWVFWLSEGAQRMRQSNEAEEGQFEGCMAFHERYLMISLVCGFAHFSFVSIAGMASFC